MRSFRVNECFASESVGQLRNGDEGTVIGLTAGARRGDDPVDELVEEPDLDMLFDP